MDNPSRQTLKQRRVDPTDRDQMAKLPGLNHPHRHDHQNRQDKGLRSATFTWNG